MSRSRKALTAAAFNYVQWVLGAGTAFYVTRFLIGALGNDLYGTWLATGALLGYAALSDLGILGIMPWLFAEADGKKDAEQLRDLLGHGLVAGAAGGVVYVVTALALWAALPGLLHLSPADCVLLRGPVLAMIVITALTYPLRVFAALRNGFQDYAFMGGWAIVQVLVNVAIVVGLTKWGFGLYGVALGAAVPGAVTGVASLVRTMRQDPGLLRLPSRLAGGVLRNIVASGTGQWMATIGWQLAFATDSVVIAYVGHRDLAPMFAVTSRLGLLLMQISWTLPDAASVGLAQLNAEGNRERVGEVVATLLRMNLLAAGFVACGVLAGNWGFVAMWVGPDLFGGSLLNGIFALDVIVLTVIHGLVVPAAVLGSRVKIGVVTLVNGVLHIGLAVCLGRAWGLVGIAAATAISGLVTSAPVGFQLLVRTTPLTARDLRRQVFVPWLLRVVPCGAVAVALGLSLVRAMHGGAHHRMAALGAGVVAGGVVALVYLLGMRSWLRELPFGERVRRVLLAVRLV